MYWLGHLGITAGAVFTSQKIFLKLSESDSKQGIRFPDFRMILVGVLLPDLIDKPIGYLFFDTTRLFGHSLAFYFLILLFGSMVFKENKFSVFVFAAAGFIHLIEDQMWKQREVLFWPFSGIGFSPTEQPGVSERLSGFLSQNYLLIPEIVGGTILIVLACRITAQKSWRKFLRKGRIN